MFKFWRQRELHAKEVAIGECVLRTSGLRNQSPVHDMKKKGGENNYANNSNLHPVITKLTKHVRVKVMYFYCSNYSNEGNPFICCLVSRIES